MEKLNDAKEESDSEAESLSDDESSDSDDSDPLEAFGLEGEPKKKSSGTSKISKRRSKRHKAKTHKEKNTEPTTERSLVKKVTDRLGEGLKIIDYGPPYSNKDPGGHLGDECAEEFPSILQIHLLLNNRANPNIPDEDELYFTPMHWCGRFLHLMVMKMLRRAGAAIDPVNEFGQTPLSLVTMMHQTSSRMQLQFKCVKWLVEHGADINHIDKGGYSPIDFAVMNRCIEIVSFLLEQGAEIRHVNKLLVVKRQGILSYVSDPDTRLLLRTRLEKMESQIKHEQEQKEQEERHAAALVRIRDRHVALIEFRSHRAEARQKEKDDAYMSTLRGMREMRVRDETRTMAEKPSFDVHKHGVWRKNEETSSWGLQTMSNLRDRHESVLPASKRLVKQMRDRNDLEKFNGRWKALTGNDLEVDWKTRNAFDGVNSTFLEDEEDSKKKNALVNADQSQVTGVAELDYRDKNDDELINENIDDIFTY